MFPSGKVLPTGGLLPHIGSRSPLAPCRSLANLTALLLTLPVVGKAFYMCTLTVCLGLLRRLAGGGKGAERHGSGLWALVQN